MTGCKDGDDGIHVITKLINFMKKYQQIFEYDEDQFDLAMKDFAITMINTDHDVGFRINLVNLESILTEKYDMYCSYDPEIYAAVKVSYMWNADNTHMDGICYCPKKCIVSKKKSEKKHNICKIITVAIFNSGKIIITGSNAFEKTKETYNYINKILAESYADVIQFSVHDCLDKKNKTKGKKGRPKKIKPKDAKPKDAKVV